MQSELKKGHLWREDETEGTEISVDYGSVWMTQEGDLHDWLLSSGERRTLERSGLVVIEAMEDASFQMKPAGIPRRINDDN